jgi:hypothetical protein
MVDAGMPPETVADKVLDAIREEKLYVLTHPELNEPIRQRVEGILASRTPVLQPPLPHAENLTRAS